MAKKILYGLISLILCAVIAFVSCYFAVPDFNTWVNDKVVSIKNIGNGGNGDNSDKSDNKPGANSVLSGNSVISESKSNGISLLTAVIPRSAMAANGINNTVDSAYTLTAEYSPAGATDIFEWTISGNEDEAITLTSYGMSATVTCNKAFDVQKVITITSTANPDINASCTVDYYKRLESVSVSPLDPITLNLGTTDVTVSLEPHYGKGTILDTEVVVGSVTVSMVSNFQNGSYCRTSSGMEADCNGKTVTGNSSTFSVIMSPTQKSSFYHLRKGADCSDVYESYFKWFVNGIGGTANNFDISVSWYAQRQGGVFNSGIATAQGRFDNSALKVAANSVTMSDTNILF